MYKTINSIVINGYITIITNKELHSLQAFKILALETDMKATLYVGIFVPMFSFKTNINLLRLSLWYVLSRGGNCLVTFLESPTIGYMDLPWV